jgi:acetoacetyl-CoA reductase
MITESRLAPFAAPKRRRRIFTGRIALVTGGTRGIGLAITQALAEAGAHVAAAYCTHAEAAAQCAQEQSAHGNSVSTHRCRIEHVADCRQLAEAVLAEHGRIDFLINNAGITLDRTLRKSDEADWRSVIDVNLGGAFNMTRAVLEHMIERGFGRIVNISSVIAATGNVGQTNYAASKAGLIGFTRSLALEVANKGITANCVAPGFVATEMLAAMPEVALANVVAKIPLKRLGKPEEIAHVVRFLCQDESAYITGAVVHINGGLAMC